MITIKRIIQTEAADSRFDWSAMIRRQYILYILIKDHQRLDSFLKFRNAIAKCHRLNEKWRYER